MNTFGLYFHVPFCEKKCPYCDFYSGTPLKNDIEEYTAGVINRLVSYAEIYSGRVIDTVYFGGGTPNLIGAENLQRILSSAKTLFSVTADAEITIEVNPGSVSADFFDEIYSAGFNRLSLGLQSANADELELLGRRHSRKDVETAVRSAQAAGFGNISLDLMIGLPKQTEESIRKSIEFCASMGVQHVSSYILKIEENTVFHRKLINGEILLPNDDRVSDLYLFTVSTLRDYGYNQYEISNFSQPGFEGKHNLHYWRAEEYLGIGPSAHSFMNGKRFYYPRNLRSFLENPEAISDGSGGGIEEKIMLKLRLTEGLSEGDLAAYPDGKAVYENIMQRAKKLPRNLISLDNEKIRLSAEGFLVSNTIISMLMPE